MVHVINEAHLKFKCPYCKKPVPEHKFETQFDADLHYKKLRCGCGKDVWFKTGMETPDSVLEKKTELEVKPAPVPAFEEIINPVAEVKEESKVEEKEPEVKEEKPEVVEEKEKEKDTKEEESQESEEGKEEKEEKSEEEPSEPEEQEEKEESKEESEKKEEQKEPETSEDESADLDLIGRLF